MATGQQKLVGYLGLYLYDQTESIYKGLSEDMEQWEHRKFDLGNLNLDPQRCFYKNDRGPEKPCKYKFTQIPQA